MLRLLPLSLTVLMGFSTSSFSADTISLKSPDGKIVFRLYNQNKLLHYRVSFQNTGVISPSRLIMTADGKELTTGTSFGRSEKYTINEQYPWLGAHSIAVNHCNGMKVSLKNTLKKFNFTIDIRVFNDGIAFRQIVNPSSGSFVPDESTEFKIPANSTVWYHDMEMHYESVHAKKLASELKEGEWVAPPGTFKMPGGIYASITESNIIDYPGMSLQADGKFGVVLRLAHKQPTSYPYRLRYSAEDTQRLMKPAILSGTVTTPWRVIIIGENLNKMVNSDIVHNLCPPPNPELFPAGFTTEWIKPGRAVWKYLNGGGDGTVEVMKKFTDGAAALGFEHNILEGFWSRWSDDQIRDLVSYSRNKGVNIWFWKHSKSLRDPKSRDSFLRKCHDLGVAGAKIDFFDHEAKEVIDLYEAILEEGARYKLMMDFHGANKPSGQARTWPNEMVREAVKGMEASRLTDRATHETTVPFTRMLAGPAEYTVMHFGARRQNTTWAHQIASAAIMHAPLLTYAAHPDTILANPAVEIIKSIPAVWDETIVLPGSEIGELAAFARRKGNTWFIAVMNGTSAKNISIPMNFLKPGKYNATIAADDAIPASVIIKKTSMTSTDVINLSLQPGGGYIAMLSQ